MMIGFSKLRKIFSRLEFLHHLRIQRACFWFCNPLYTLCMYSLLTVLNTNFRIEKIMPYGQKSINFNTFVSNACSNCFKCFCEYSMKEVFTNTRYYTPQTCHITGTFNLLCHIIPQFVPQLRLTMRQ